MYDERFGQHLPPIRREDVWSPASPSDLVGQKPSPRHDPEGGGKHGAAGRPMRGGGVLARQRRHHARGGAVAKPGCAGAVAFSRSGDPGTGEFGDATLIRKLGDVREDLSTL
jgi:hypothetical protein